MSDKSLIEVMREYVRARRPSGGEIEIIDERKWVFVYRAVSGSLRRALAGSSGEDTTNYVFADKIKIDGLPGISGSINAVFLEDVTFSNIHFGNDFTLYIEAADTATIRFINCHISNKLKIRNPEHKEAQDNKAKVGGIKFSGCSMAGGESGQLPYLRVGFLDVDKFKLENLRIPNAAEVNIGDCRFNHFQMSNVRNLGKLKLYKINILENEKKNNAEFRLDNTSIGDADFQSVDLSSFAKRIMFDNILVGLKYSNVLVEPKGTDIEVDPCADTKDKIIKKRNIIKKRDTYRVLKNVALYNNDHVHALAFYAKEMKYHRKAINLFSLEHIILTVNYWASNFGQNWFLPLLWIAVLGIASYALLLCSLNLSFCNCNNWAQLPLFFSPLHETEFIKNGDWGFWAYTIDFGFRVVEGSLIYQAIQAFRRYTRNI